MQYSTRFSIGLIPHGVPKINYGVDAATVNTELIVSQPMTLNFDLDLSAGAHTVFLDFYNKTNDLPETALEIEYVEFEGMRLDRFKWSSRYYPVYPEPWASQQDHLPEFHASATYMGWNGRWELYFDTPIFTWIHRLENLGWIYS